jgi:hypothetical protein
MSRFLLTQDPRHLPPWLIFDVRQNEMKAAAIIITSVALAGCSATDVRVVDEASRPLADVEVRPVAASIDLAPIRTDKHGVARLPYSPQEIQWISVRKAGYLPVENLALAGKREIQVELKNEERK